MLINKVKFFDTAKILFGKYAQPQVDGINFLLDRLITSALTDKRQVAYMLATVFHETAKTMQPIEEYGKGHGRAYGNEMNGHIYYGRGYVQLTWYYNYDKMGMELGIDLFNNPGLALEPNTALAIMIEGMTNGFFTEKKLSDYFNENTDWKNARRIINGNDKDETIAGYAKIFYKSL